MAEKLTDGAVVKPASTHVNKTGAWRSMRPVVDLEKCVKCYICIDLCPEGAISALPEKKGVQVDYDYCKGCGICSSACPQTAYTMVREEK